MKVILVLAFNSLREMVRDRTVSLIFFAALALVVLASLLGSLSFDEQRRILIHLGFAAIHWSALGLVLFQGAFTLQREIERQTCLMVLARPVGRCQFLLGKFSGLTALLLLHLATQGILLYALLGFQADLVRFSLVLAGIFLEALILLAFVFFIVQWVRPVVAIFGGWSLFMAGNWLDEMRFLASRSKDTSFLLLSKVLEKTVPNFYLLNFRSESFLENGDMGSAPSLLILHFSLWFALFLILGIYSFTRRDLV